MVKEAKPNGKRPKAERGVWGKIPSLNFVDFRHDLAMSESELLLLLSLLRKFFLRMEAARNAGQWIVLHPTLVSIGEHAEAEGMEVQFGELIGYEGSKRLGLDVLLGLDFAREHLTVVLDKELNLECGVVLAVVIGGDASYADEFLQEVTLGKSASLAVFAFFCFTCPLVPKC